MTQVLNWNEIPKTKTAHVISRRELKDVILRPTSDVRHNIRFIGLPCLCYRIWWDNTWFNLANRSAAYILYKNHRNKVKYKPRPTYPCYGFMPVEDKYVIYECNQKITSSIMEWKKVTEKAPSSLDGTSPIFIISKTGQGINTRYSCIAGNEIALTNNQKDAFQEFSKTYDLASAVSSKRVS